MSKSDIYKSLIRQALVYTVINKYPPIILLNITV